MIRVVTGNVYSHNQVFTHVNTSVNEIVHKKLKKKEMQGIYVVCINSQSNLNHNQQNTSRWYGNNARRHDNDHKYCCNFFRKFRLYNLSNLKKISSI